MRPLTQAIHTDCYVDEIEKGLNRPRTSGPVADNPPRRAAVTDKPHGQRCTALPVTRHCLMLDADTWARVQAVLAAHRNGEKQREQPHNLKSSLF